LTIQLYRYCPLRCKNIIKIMVFDRFVYQQAAFDGNLATFSYHLVTRAGNLVTFSYRLVA